MTLTEFSEKLQEELHIFVTFERLLQDEQQALVSGNIDALIALAPSKAALIEQLSSFAENRARMLSLSGEPPSAAGMQRWMDTMEAPEETRQAWEQLLAQAREAEQINRRNGSLIESHLQHNRQALSVLRSAARPGENLYSAKGQISPMDTSHTLGKA